MKNLSPQDFFRQNNLEQSEPKILFLGGLSAEKGTLLILKVFEKLLKKVPNTKLLVAGYFDTSFKSFFNLKKFGFAQNYKKNVLKVLRNLDNSVVFLGPIKNVPQAMQASDVIVFPATVGHFARPVIEAGFMAKPVVASNLSPLDELVINNKTGFLVDPKDEDMWVEKLMLLLKNKELNKRIGEGALQYCMQNFDIQDQICKVEKVYCQLTN